MSRWEGSDAIAQTCEVFWFACKYYGAATVVTVIERADADRVSGCDIAVCFGIIYYHREFGVEHREHVCAVFSVHREQDLAVGTACKFVLCGELGLEFFESVDLAVAYGIAAVELERLHPFRCKPHDGQAVKGQQTVSGVCDTAVIGTSRYCLVKSFYKFMHCGAGAAVAHDRTHCYSSFTLLRRAVCHM